MQIALLIFIMVFTLAIGFFLGLFLLSTDTPLARKLGRKDQTAETPESDITESEPTQDIPKPSPESKLILKVWKEEGKPPVYDLDGKFVSKEDLPKDFLNFITVQEKEAPVSEEQAPMETEEAPEVAPVEEEVGEGEVKMLSVVDEVNDILQKNLAGSPLAGKGIHLYT